MKQKLGSRLGGLGEKIPSVEWEFHNLPASERKACLRYELYREREFCHCEALREEAAAMESEAAERGTDIFRELLELQNELDNLRPNLRPWLSLSEKDKAPFFLRKAQPDFERIINEPVWATADLTAFQKWRVKSGGKRMSLEVNVDWSKSDGAIVNSFAKLVKSLREGSPTGKKLPSRTETKGDKTTPDEQLFFLAIWRLRKAGIRPTRVIEIVKPLKIKFSMADEETLRKKLASYARKAERLL